jgi:hypothetical protein
MGFRLSDENPLRVFQELGLPITWTLVRIGWDGPGNYRRQLSAKNVRELASRLLECDPSDPHALQVLILRDEEINELEQTIRAASAQERFSEETELTKWLVVRLLPLLDRLPTDDPVEGLTSIADFWYWLDFPEHSPYQFPNDRNCGDHYSQRNYERVIADHRKWAADEVLRLRSAK